MRAVLLGIALLGCGAPAPHPALYAAGSDKDDGHGLLARASSTLLTNDHDGVEPSPFPARSRRTAYGGDTYGGDAYGGGGGAYGGAHYGNYAPPGWTYPSANRTPHYTSLAGLTGVVEGVVTWRGAPPAKLATSCGAIEPLHVGTDHAIAGALVYIERITTGRKLAHEGGERRPSTVGGVIAKHGCAFVPAVQLVTPVPAALSIHGDAARTTLRITTATGTSSSADLQEAGRVALQVRPGVTRVEADDGTLAAAWVVALETPSYAITDDAGRFRIEELAPGTYDVSFWLSPIPSVVDGKLRYGAPVIAHRSITVGPARPAHLDVALGR
jgi:hypothetical protein